MANGKVQHIVPHKGDKVALCGHVFLHEVIYTMPGEVSPGGLTSCKPCEDMNILDQSLTQDWEVSQ